MVDAPRSAGFTLDDEYFHRVFLKIQRTELLGKPPGIVTRLSLPPFQKQNIGVLCKYD
jgi:hypothetical protein